MIQFRISRSKMINELSPMEAMKTYDVLQYGLARRLHGICFQCHLYSIIFNFMGIHFQILFLLVLSTFTCSIASHSSMNFAFESPAFDLYLKKCLCLIQSHNCQSQSHRTGSQQNENVFTLTKEINCRLRSMIDCVNSETFSHQQNVSTFTSTLLILFAL